MIFTSCHQIMIICHLEVEILHKLDSHGGHLKKWPKPISRLEVIPRSIANNIARKLLIKTKSGGGGGCMVTNSGPWTTYVNYKSAWIKI